MTARELLLHLDPWLQRKCQALAARLPGLDKEEAYQQVVEEFLEKIEVWLQQDATVDVIAQARTLMAFCLQHVATIEIRERKRRQEVPEGEDGEGLERLAPPTNAVDATAAWEVLRQVRSCTSPPCALCLLSLRLPAIVERTDAEQAKAWTKGGSKAVPRAVDEAWEIYTTGRARIALVADNLRWKRHVGVAWYTEGTVEALTLTDLNMAAEKVQRYANRGAEDLRATLLGQGKGP